MSKTRFCQYCDWPLNPESLHADECPALKPENMQEWEHGFSAYNGEEETDYAKLENYIDSLVAAVNAYTLGYKQAKYVAQDEHDKSACKAPKRW